VSDKVTGDEVVIRQQFALPTTDIRSEIYSLGVTLYFLLSGVALSTETLQRGPTFSGFPRPLRALLGRLLHRDPDQRPKDLLIVTELIRESLGKIDRRRELSDRYGIPLRTSVPRPRAARRSPLAQVAAAVGVLLLLLLLAAAIAPLVFPDSISKLVREIRKPKEVGVMVGVPDSSPAPSQSSTLPQVPVNPSTSPATVVSSQAAGQTVLPESSAPANAATTPNPFHIAPADVEQAQVASSQPQAAAPANPPQNNPAATPDSSVPGDSNANLSAQASTEPSPATASQSASRSTEKSVASKSKRARPSRSSPAYSSQGRVRSVRSRVTGITSDGRLILRLPSGRTAIVAPDEDESMPRHRNRVYMDRDQMFGPPPGFGPEYYPGD
jgi:hypothetical protein